MRSFTSFLSLCFIGSLISTQSFAQTTKAPDIRRDPTLYVVPYAHLDTQWRWEFPQTISEYLLKTMRTNFYLIDKYPHYVINWTGANRYRLMKEYFPSDYAKVKQYVDAGRWFPAGSSVEEGDVNLPSAEAIIRQVLYGNTYFRKEFGKASEEYMLPDCFGFPASLPSILAHAGVRGFSTQKLSASWQPSPKVGGPGSVEATPEGIPFNVGIWEGPDGKTVIAALNPGDYGSQIRGDLSKPPVPPTAQQLAALTPQERQFVQSGRFHGDENWVKRIDLDGKVTGVFADYHYIGTGDIGGSVNEESVKLLEAMATHGMAAIPPMQLFGRRAAAQPASPATPEVRMGDGPVHVIPATADQMFRDIKPEMTAKMPRYKGDLELINHSAGSLTSQAAHKRWIRRSEVFADAAEKASVAAEWLGGQPYPQERLNNAWTLVMGGHFHDTAAGTATPKAYEYAQNDDVLALNQFAAVLTDATAAVASGLDTQTAGTPIVVYNSLNIARQDIVRAKVTFAGGAPKAVRVTGPDGAETPAQLEGGDVIFLANVPSAGYAVYSVQAAAAPATGNLKVFAPPQGGFRGGAPSGPPASLENARYRVTVDASGDISSIFDKSLDKELLSAPIRLAISTDHPREWPAWNMDFDQEQAPPRIFVRGGRIRVAENGPARVALEVTRQTEGSRYVQTISLAAGDAGNRLEIRNSVNWGTMLSNVKAVFALTASNPLATYNWGLGTIQRPNAAERSFEVASHQWIDLTDKSGAYGATILTDCQNGSDKRDDRTLRLTLLRSPGTDNGYTDQANQDFGHHDFAFGITGHKGDWREAQTDWQGQRLNAPLIAFETVKHPGILGKTFSLVNVDNSRIQVMALKKAELSDELVIRMVELDGKPQANVHVKFPGSVTAAREINGQELPVGQASVEQGSLATSFTAYQPRSFAVKLAPAAVKVAEVRSQPVDLAYDLSVASNDDTKTVGGMGGKGSAYPAEMLPAKIEFDGVGFRLAPARTGVPNATVAKGQKVALPAGAWNRIYVLAASADGDQTATFEVGDRPAEFTVEYWGGMIGQADTRLWRNNPYTEADWAVSANHAKWDPDPAKQRDPSQAKRDWAPRYPEDFAGIKPGFIKPAAVAWFASHHHTPEGLNQPYSYSYLFAYAIDAPQNAKTLTLPNNDKVRVLAISVAEQVPALQAAQSLY